MPIAVIAFDFDALLRLGDGLVLRWQTVALAAVIAACLIVSGVLARRAGLRDDDLLYIAVGAVPGAVIGGRLGQLATMPEAFAGGLPSVLDPAIGGLELGLGVVGGVLTAAYVARLLGAPVGRWAATLALPLLVAIGAGKVSMALGGSGQGSPLDAAWSTAYLGDGPWGSLAPTLPSHPAQLYEGLASLAVALVLVILGVGWSGARDGRLLLVVLGAWAVIRTVVTVTWRDPAVLGPLPAGGVIAAGIAVGAVVALVAATLWSSRQARARTASADGEDGPSWPDPETRAQF